MIDFLHEVPALLFAAFCFFCAVVVSGAVGAGAAAGFSLLFEKETN